MSLHEITLEGTLKPDGTLELDRKPSLPPGRVVVTVRGAAETPMQENWWQYMQRIRAEREAAGYPFMNEREMQAHIDWLRDDDDRIERIYQQTQQRQVEGESA